MFFFAAFLVGFLLTAFLAPKPKIENARAASLNDFSFPRADEGDPVPRVYGTVKMKSPNTVWRGDFKTVAITKKVKTGLFSSKRQTVGYKYYIGLDLVFCLGPNIKFRRLWAGKYELWNGCQFDLECYNVAKVNQPELFGGQDKNGGFVGDIAMYCGDFDQPYDPYVQSKLAANGGEDGDLYPAYPGIAHIVLRQCYVGNSPNMEAIYAELQSFPDSPFGDLDFVAMPNGFDCNPIAVLYDIYINDWGNLDIDPALIDVEQWQSIAETVRVEGNGISVIVANANQGADVTKEILRQINGTIYQNPATGLFELKLIRSDYNVEDLPVFGPSEIKDVKNFTKKLWSETFNRVRLKFVDRTQDYKQDVIAVADDFANIRFQGKIRPTEVSMPTCYDSNLANILAARELSNKNVPLYQAELQLNREAAALAPGAPFVFNWPEYGIYQMVMRVRKFGLGTLKDGTISMSVVQDEFALDSVVVGPPSNGAVKPVVEPAVLTPLWFELPYWLKGASDYSTTDGEYFFALLMATPTPYSSGYNFLDVDLLGGEPTYVLAQEPYTATAKLNADVARFAGFNAEGVQDNVYIRDVSDPTVLTTVTADTMPGTPMSQGHGLVYLNGELLAYTGAYEVEEEPGVYRLGNVHRAMIDTGWIGGVEGDTLFFINAATGFIDQQAPLNGYLQDVTTAGSLPVEDLDLVSTPEGGRSDLPLPPDYVTLDTFHNTNEERDAGETVALAWVERNRLTNPTHIKFEDDDTEEPEAGTTYRVVVETELGDEIIAADDLPDPEYDLALTNDMAGKSVILIYAKRDGLLSFSGSPFPITVIPTDETLTVDGYLVTVDDETVDVS